MITNLCNYAYFDGPDFEPREKQVIFYSPHSSRTALGPMLPPVKWVTGLLPVGTATGTCTLPPTTKVLPSFRLDGGIPLLPFCVFYAG